MPPPTRSALAGLLLCLCLGYPAPSVQAIDPHQVYERRCAGCHEAHAGDFVPGALDNIGGRIVGLESGRELRNLLEAGHGRLAADEIAPLVAHLTFVFEAGGLFRTKCGICHGRASDLARATLALRGGRPVGRYSGRDIAGFLESHGRLATEEIAVVLAALERQLAGRRRDRLGTP